MNGIWQQPSGRQTVETLFSLGYFQGKEWDEVRTFLLGDKVVKDAVEKYADFHEVKGEEPTEHMLRPRCGLPDFVRDPQEAGLCKWPMLDVTASDKLSGLNPLTEEQEHAAWLEAIDAWNRVCGIRLAHTEDHDRANIYADPGSTGSGVLAYSYLPCNASPTDRLQQVYNRSTNWSYRLLVNVIIHEIGHAIGLDHGPRGSIMQPTAAGDITRPQSWDVQQVVARYGQPSPVPQPPIPQPPIPGFAFDLKSDLRRGFYYLERAEVSGELTIRQPIQPGKYRVLSEFEMG